MTESRVSPKHIWVCSTCGQGVTRKGSAARHNDNLHSGGAMIVRPFEYIIGRLEGKFVPARDPLSFRSKKNNKGKQKDNKVFGLAHSLDNNYDNNSNSDKNNNNKLKFSKAFVADNTKVDDLAQQLNMPPRQNKPVKNDSKNDDTHGMPSSSSYLHPDYLRAEVQQQAARRTVIDEHKPSHDMHKLAERKSKLVELEILLNKHYPRQKAIEFLSTFTYLLNQINNDEFLDKQLIWLRNIDRAKNGFSSE